MRYWYGNEGGFPRVMQSDHTDRTIRKSAEDGSGCGPVRIYPRWRSGEPGRIEGLGGGETMPQAPVCEPAAIPRHQAGRPATYRPDLSRAEAKRQRERERYARRK